MDSKQNKMHMWALAFAARNRIGFGHLTSEATVRAQDIPLHLFLPTKYDAELQRNRMEVIVQRILRDHMPEFQDCVVCDHIPHDYSAESSIKSRIVIICITQLTSLKRKKLYHRR